MLSKCGMLQQVFDNFPAYFFWEHNVTAVTLLTLKCFMDRAVHYFFAAVQLKVDWNSTDDVMRTFSFLSPALCDTKLHFSPSYDKYVFPSLRKHIDLAFSYLKFGLPQSKEGP